MVFQGSNVLNIKNRINSLSIESAFYIYISFNLINLVIHILGYYSYPMFAQFDYCLYLAKIGIVVFLRYLLHKKDFRFSLERKLFKAIIVLDAIELFISIFAYRYAHTYYIIGLTLSLKVVLDFCIFTSLLKKGKKKADDSLNAPLLKEFTAMMTYWNAVNISIVVISFFIAFTRLSFVIISVYALAIERSGYQIYLIKKLWSNVYKQPESELIEKKNASGNSSNKIIIFAFKTLRYGIYACLFIALMLLRNSYTEGSLPLTDYDGNVVTIQKTLDDLSKEHESHYYTGDNVYQYNACNKMPSWSIFYHEKYGLINATTGENTGAKYDDYLFFDDAGIAYDNDRHFIDRSGKEVLKVPYIVNANTSYRQEFFNILMKAFSDKKSYFKWVDNFRSECVSYFEWYLKQNHNDNKFVLDYDHNYFEKGVAAYYTEYNGKYGLIKDDGTLITLPKFSEIDGCNDFEVSTVKGYYGWTTFVIDSTGRKLPIKNSFYYKYYKEARLIFAGDYLYSFDGNRIDEGYFEYIEYCGDLTCFIKKGDHPKEKGTLVVYYGNAELLFSSDQYDYCYARADENGAITYMVAHNENGYVLIDTEGRLICPNTYSHFVVTEDFNTFLGIDSDSRIDILRLDGTIIRTDYRIVDWRPISSTYQVRKMDDVNLYNEMDLNGNLLGEWIEDEDK